MIFLQEPDWGSFSSKGKEDARGYTYAPANSEQRDNTLDRTTMGGRATHYGPNGEVYGSSGQQMAQNYTSLGQAAALRGAYQNDWTQANASRGQQGNAMGLMQSAAYGQQPSAAQIQGRNMLDQSLQNQMAAAASARGGSLAQAAAMRNAATAGAAQQQQGMNNLAALRAQEMAQARGDYFGAASGMRQQDIGQQGMNMQSELSQRQLNQQGQQFYDQLGWDTLRADQEAAMHQANIDSQEYIAQKQQNTHSEDRSTNVASSVIGAIGGFFASDMRAKTDMMPVGGVAQPMGGSRPSFGSVVGGRGGMMMSDARAKREAFEEGAKYADAQHAGVPMKAPDYAKSAPTRGRNPAAGPSAEEIRDAELAQRARAASAMAAQVQQPPQQVITPQPVQQPAQQTPAAALGRAVSVIPPFPVSDDRAKVIDLDEPEAGSDVSTMRDGSSDARTNSFDKTFRRDTPADQKRVKRAVEDQAGRDADAMMGGYAAALAKGPATEEALARANRSMAGSSYAYKPEFTPPDQVPGEKNVGPMAQNMAADPLASTAVKQDPQSGMLVLDSAKMLKLNSAGIASLQRQVDSLAAAVAKRGRS